MMELGPISLLGFWNSHVHREFPGHFESSNLSRDNLSGEIGRKDAFASRAARSTPELRRPMREGTRPNLRTLPRESAMSVATVFRSFLIACRKKLVVAFCLTACRKEAEARFPLPLAGAHSSGGTTLANRLAASRNYKLACTDKSPAPPSDIDQILVV